MKKKKILVFLVAASYLCGVMSAVQDSPLQASGVEEFSFDDDQFSGMPEYRVHHTSIVTEQAKDLAAFVVQRCLSLYLVLYGWTQRLYKEMLDGSDGHE